MKKQLLKKFYACLPIGMAFIITVMLFSVSANAQNVNIPDSIFKSRLVNNASINTNGDGEIQVTEATAFNGFMDVATGLGPGIMDLTGIEAFTAITGLNCSYNFFSSVDLSYNTALTVLWCTACIQLISLDVSSNTALTQLWCWQCKLTSLDVSANTTLNDLDCRWNNLLTSLNVQNGNNSNFTNFNAKNNPNLTCIKVDSVAYSNANWSAGKDAGASFSTNCGALFVPIMDNLVSVQLFPNPATNHLTIALSSNSKKVEVTIADITGKIIYKTSAFAAQKIEMNTNDFAAGVYAVHVQSADFIGTKKLVVEK